MLNFVVIVQYKRAVMCGECHILHLLTAVNGTRPSPATLTCGFKVQSSRSGVAVPCRPQPSCLEMWTVRRSIRVASRASPAMVAFSRQQLLEHKIGTIERDGSGRTAI